MSVKKISLSLLFICTAFIKTSHAFSVRSAAQQLPPGTNLSLYVKQVNSNTPIISYNADQMMMPASTQKVITALAAMLELGPNFRFKTTLNITNSINNRVLKGNIVLRFSGDPTLTRKQIKSLFSELAAKATTIEGDLIIDTSVFSGHYNATGWSWNNMTACYNAPPSPIIIDKNCFYASIAPSSKIGGKATITANSAYHVKLESQVISIPSNTNDKYCELNVRTRDNNHYIFSGCVAQKQKPFSLSFAIQDTNYYGEKVIQDILAETNIRLRGQIKFNSGISGKITQIASIQSEPLTALLDNMLMTSNNMIADTLFKTIGLRKNGVGTWKAGAFAVHDILKTKANIDLKNSRIYDGSGLSRQNQISAKNMSEVIDFIVKNNDKLGLLSYFPVAAEKGSLKNRVSMQNINKCITAKTGYLDGSYNLAGLIKTKSGKLLSFTQFTSGYVSQQSVAKNEITQFEKSLYQYLCSL